MLYFNINNPLYNFTGMPGRGFLKSHLAQMNGSAGPPKLIHSQDDVTSKVSVHAECNGFHKQENTLNIAVPEKCNGISKQNNIPKVTVAKQFNGIHKQDNVLKVTDLKECNGIHKQDNVPKVTVPVVSNGIIPQAVRGRRVIIINILHGIRSNLYLYYCFKIPFIIPFQDSDSSPNTFPK